MSRLPVEIHFEIVKQLRLLLDSAEYFLDLRRTSKSFNETILRLLFDDPTFCFSCLTHTTGSSTCPGESTRFRAHHNHIPRFALASSQLSALCARLLTSSIYPWAAVLERSVIILKQVLQSLSSSPYESLKACRLCTGVDSDDYAWNLVCQSANQAIYRRALLSRDHGEPRIFNVLKEEAEFWVVNAACYLGSQSLLEKLFDKEFSREHNLSDMYTRRSAMTCLSIAIMNGHAGLARFIILQNMPNDRGSTWHYNYSDGLVAAITEGSTSTVKLLLDKLASSHDLGHHVLFSVTEYLMSLPSHAENVKQFSATLRLLLPYMSTSRKMLQSKITMMSARLGNASDIQLLADHKLMSSNHALLLNPIHDEASRISTIASTALASAAGSGKLEVMEALLDRHYLAEVSNSRIRLAVLNAAEQALRAGHVHIYVALKKRFPDILRSMKTDFEMLALLNAVNVPQLMRDRLEDEQFPQKFLLECASLTYSWTEQATRGATALYLALHDLRWRNVEFLLSMKFILKKAVVVQIPWMIYSTRKTAYERTQEVVRRYDASVTLEVKF